MPKNNKTTRDKLDEINSQLRQIHVIGVYNFMYFIFLTLTILFYEIFNNIANQVPKPLPAYVIVGGAILAAAIITFLILGFVKERLKIELAKLKV